MLEIHDLTVSYGAEKTAAPVIRGLSFSLEEGGLLAVLGPSGCGKTTLLHALAGIISPRSGMLSLDGTALRPDTVPIGLIPQNYGLLPWKTVRQNILFCAPPSAQTGSLEPLCQKLGIAGLLDRYPATLSGGQAQRAALARALFLRPRLLLLDEPFAALDAAAALSAQQLCLDLWREGGMTAVAVTHRLEEALFLAGQVAVMGRGGRFLCVCGNPWQGMENCTEPEYFALSSRLREEILRAAREEDPA